MHAKKGIASITAVLRKEQPLEGRMRPAVVGLLEIVALAVEGAVRLVGVADGRGQPRAVALQLRLRLLLAEVQRPHRRHHLRDQRHLLPRRRVQRRLGHDRGVQLTLRITKGRLKRKPVP